MRTRLQSGLLRLYRAALGTGVLSTTWGRAAFNWAYDQYKTRLEAGDIHALQSLVRPATTVIDVGANVGFFTRRFAHWVTQGGRVIAIEPEGANFEQLKRVLKKSGLMTKVETIQAVAAETDGMLRLRVNPFHPADHRIDAQGVAVRSMRLDTLAAERGWPDVSLVKIDVQGAEMRVLDGARVLVEKSQPALFMEVDDRALERMGSSAERLLRLLEGDGYIAHRSAKGRISPPLSTADALPLCRGGRYADFLFLHRASKKR